MDVVETSENVKEAQNNDVDFHNKTVEEIYAMMDNIMSDMEKSRHMFVSLSDYLKKKENYKTHIIAGLGLEVDEEIEFNDFLLLRYGPLEFGSKYIDSILKYCMDDSFESKELSLSNKVRTELAFVIKKGFEILINLKEFKRWNNKTVQVGFITQLLTGSGAESNRRCFRKNFEPIGIKQLLFRLRYCYNYESENCTKTSETDKLNGRIGRIYTDASEEQKINFASERFTKELEKKLKASHVNNWSLNGSGAKNIIESEPTECKVTQHSIEGCKSKVWHLQNFLSPAKVQETKREINKLAFQDYDSSSKLSDRYIRVSSESYGNFLVGKGPKTRIYGSLPFSTIEQDIVNYMNGVIELYQEFIKDVGYNVRKVDLLQIVKDNLGSGYGEHSDDGALVCKYKDEEGSKEDGIANQIVISLILSSSEEKSAKVIWKNKFMEGKEVEVLTGDNEVHFQAVNVQKDCVHRVEKHLNNKIKRLNGRQWRLVISGRASLFLQPNKEIREKRIKRHVYGFKKTDEVELPEIKENYNKINILTDKDGLTLVDCDRGSDEFYDKNCINNPSMESIENKRKMGEEQNEKGLDSESQVKKKRRQLEKWKLEADKFHNIDFDNNITNLFPVNPVIINEKFCRLAVSGKWYENALKNNVYYELKDTKNGKSTLHGPWVNEDGTCSLKIKETVDCLTLRRRFNIPDLKGKDGATACWAANANNINGILLEKDFKNDIESINAILNNEVTPKMWIGLRGGGGQVRGDTVLGNSNHFESGYFATWQRLEGFNSALMDAAMRRIVVPIFIVSKKDDRKGIFLGNYKLNGFCTAEDSFEELERIAIKFEMPENDQVFMRFREVLHVRIEAISIDHTIKRSKSEKWTKISVSGDAILPIGTKTLNSESGIVNSRQVLSITDSHAASIEKVIAGFNENKDWENLDDGAFDNLADFTEKEAEKEQQIMNKKPSSKKKKESKKMRFGVLRNNRQKDIKIGKLEFTNFVQCCSVAVFCRMLKMNIVLEKNTQTEKVGILPEKTWIKRLGNILRYLGTPHPIRCYDTVPLILIISTNSLSDERNRRKGYNWVKKNKDVVKDLFFQSFMACLAGRVGNLSEWVRYRRETNLETEDEDSSIRYPKTGEIEDFLHFVKIATSSSKNPTTRWINEQYKASLPSFCSDYDQYANSILKLSEKMDDLVELYETTWISCDNGKNPDCRQKFLQHIQNLIMEVSIENKKFEFFSNQVLLNMEEIMCLFPYNKNIRTPLGYGSKQVLPWCSNQDTSKNDQEILNSLLLELLKLKDPSLDALGLFKRDGIVLTKLNHRPVDVRDIEHMLCKIWIVMSRVIGGRPSSHPQLDRPQYHPIKTKYRSEPHEIIGERATTIAEQGISAFQNSLLPLKIPPIFEISNQQQSS